MKRTKKEAKEDEEMDLSQALDLDQSQLLMISQVPETEENEGMCSNCKNCTENHCNKCEDKQKEIEKLNGTIKNLKKENLSAKKKALENQKNMASVIEENAKLQRENVILRERKLMEEEGEKIEEEKIEGEKIDEQNITLTEDVSDTEEEGEKEPTLEREINEKHKKTCTKKHAKWSGNVQK